MVPIKVLNISLDEETSRKFGLVYQAEFSQYEIAPTQAGRLMLKAGLEARGQDLIQRGLITQAAWDKLGGGK